jgi:tetratricopeptide (TPR) repeat protein
MNITKAARHWAYADQYFQEKNYQQAINEWKCVLRYAPTDFAAYYRIAKTYFILGSNTLALDYFYQAAMLAIKMGNLDYAESIYKNMLEINSNSRQVLMLKRNLLDACTDAVTRTALAQ